MQPVLQDQPGRPLARVAQLLDYRSLEDPTAEPDTEDSPCRFVDDFGIHPPKNPSIHLEPDERVKCIFSQLDSEMGILYFLHGRICAGQWN